jgi:hypothetical protein
LGYNGPYNQSQPISREDRGCQGGQQAFGQLLGDAQREPVLIERNGCPVTVVLPVAKYEIFQRLEDAH